MSDFEFPTNIKQIGSISGGLRIYIEDYAYTYLKQYAEAGGYDERIALLIGRNMIIDEKRVLFISGAIQGKYAEQEQGMLIFSEKSMNHAYEKMKTYFRGLEIVGWMQSQPSYGVTLNSNSIAYHACTFLKPDQVLFLMDPIEDLNAFYTWSSEKEDLEETRGYFIYYDKNRGMQEYILESRAKDETVQSTFRLLTKPAEYSEPTSKAWSEKTVEEDERPAVPVSFVKPRMAGSASPIQERRLNNLLVSLSAVLVLVCFIMGAGLIQNESRISNLETQLNQLTLLTMSYYTAVSSAESTTEPAFSQTQQSETPGMKTPESTVQGQNSIFQESATTRANIPAQEALTQQTFPEPVVVSPKPTPELILVIEPNPTPTPVQGTLPVTTVIPETYTIEPGDSLTYISQRFYGTADMVPRIMEINNIENPNLLLVGATIWLPRP